jgi:two-component sensor histidine kinase
LALIINEALTNSIKYAFPDNTRGQIRIALKDMGEVVELELTDNGVGMSNTKDDQAPVSLGLMLIEGLTKEIQGELKIDSNSGFRITIVFRKTTVL